MTRNAYIFMDFDGVTHPWGEVEDFRCLPHIEAVVREFPEARIVIASDWRMLFSLPKLVARFSEDIRPQIAGATPHLLPKTGAELHGLREREAMAWLRQHGADPRAIANGKCPAVLQITRKRPRRVVLRINDPPGDLVIGQLHDVVVKPFGVIAPGMQDVDQARMILGDFLKFLDALKLPLEGPVPLEILPAHDFDGPVGSGDTAREEDLAIRTSADPA